MIAIIIVLFVAFVSYIGYVISEFGVLPSISDSWYKFPAPKNSLFTCFMFIMGWCLVIVGRKTNLDVYLWAGGFVSFVGVAAMFKESKFIGFVHGFVATIGIVLSLIGLMHEGFRWPILLLIIFVVSIDIAEIKNKVWWMEVVSYALIMAGFIHRFL